MEAKPEVEVLEIVIMFLLETVFKETIPSLDTF
jgi:hypothetical protein